MGNLNQAFKSMLIILLFLFLMISHTSSSSSSSSSSHSSNNKDMIQSQNPSSIIPAALSHYHQVFYLKNTDHDPMFLRRQERIKKRRMNRNKNMMKKHRKHRKKIVKNMQSSRPFSVMLPKGFVPPSGSSPCHNDQPNFMSFHCHLTSAKP